VQRDFTSDLQLAEESEKLIFEKILKPKGFIQTGIQYWFAKYGVKITKELPEECDFIHREHQRYGVEVKSLAGGYPTFCIEKYSDDLQIHNPGWYKSTETKLLRKVIIHNRADGYAYIYSPEKLLEQVKLYPDTQLTRARNGCRDDSGWLAKFGWEDPDVGYIMKVKIS
jgi:hypothetical protein